MIVRSSRAKVGHCQAPMKTKRPATAGRFVLNFLSGTHRMKKPALVRAFSLLRSALLNAATRRRADDHQSKREQHQRSRFRHRACDLQRDVLARQETAGARW